MGFSNDYQCDRCHDTYSVSTVTLRVYDLEFGDKIPCAACLGWCSRCERLVAMERIPVFERVVDHLQDLESMDVDDEQVVENANEMGIRPEVCLSRRISLFRRVVRWRSERTSPPRCLECGSVGAQEVTDESKEDFEFQHPSCGGTIRWKSWYHFSEASVQVLTPEGRTKLS